MFLACQLACVQLTLLEILVHEKELLNGVETDDSFQLRLSEIVEIVFT